MQQTFPGLPQQPFPELPQECRRMLSPQEPPQRSSCSWQES